MGDAAAGLHEARELLSAHTIELHRAVRSLIEELEAVDWYAQRIDASRDEALKAVLAHSLEEEKEHACMTLEWIRRNDAGFDASLRRFLFRERAEADEPHETPPERNQTLGIGSLRTAAS
jgi:ferritin-like protein